MYEDTHTLKYPFKHVFLDKKLNLYVYTCAYNHAIVQNRDGDTLEST